MATDLTALAETFARYSRQVAGLAEPPPALTPPPLPPGVDPARSRVAEQMRVLDAEEPPPAGVFQRMWLQALKHIRYLEAEDYAAALDRYLAVAEAGLRFVAACRAALAPTNGDADLLDAAERRYAFVARTAREKKDAIGKPSNPRDPERYAEAMRQAAEGRFIPAHVVMAELNRRADAERAGQ